MDISKTQLNKLARQTISRGDIYAIRMNESMGITPKVNIMTDGSFLLF